MSLRSTTQRVLAEIPREIICQYETIKSVLMQRFCLPEQITAHRCEFRNGHRNREESVAEYGYALKRLACRAFPSIHIHVEMRESFIVDQYINGLTNQEMKIHVQFAHPNILHRVISLAVEFEAFEVSYNVLRKPNELNHSNVMALTNTGNFEKNNQKLQYQFTSQSDNARLSLEDSLRDVRESLKSLVDKKDKSPQTHKTERGSDKRGSNRIKGSKPFVCYNCNEEGHISRNCPQKNADSI